MEGKRKNEKLDQRYYWRCLFVRNFLLRFRLRCYSLGIVTLPRIIVTLCFLPETAPLVLLTRGVSFCFIMSYCWFTVHH